jgi:hypothetical protein
MAEWTKPLSLLGRGQLVILHLECGKVQSVADLVTTASCTVLLNKFCNHGWPTIPVDFVHMPINGITTKEPSAN